MRIDPYLPYRRSLLPPGRVRELSRRRPRRAARDVAVSWAIIVAAWVLAARVGTWWAVLAAIPVVGNRYYALYIIGHDGLHRRLLDTTKGNDLFADGLVFAPIGAITRINNRNHLLHHQHLANEDDPDRHKHGCFNKATRLELVGYLTSVTSVLHSVAHVFLPGRRAAASPEETGEAPSAATAPRPPYRARDLALLAMWQVVLFAALTMLFGWWAYLVLWWVPVFVFTFLADNLRAFVEHSQISSDAEADAGSARLITHQPGWLERQLVAPMHMNFHAAHHLWPSIPYYNLPVADAEMRAAAGDAPLDRRRSYLGYLWRYYRALPLEACRPAAARV